MKCLGKAGFIWRLGLLIIPLSGLLVGCAEQVPSPETLKTYEEYRKLLENATAPSAKTEKEFEKKELKPLFKEISPLKKIVSVSFYQEHYENVLFFLAYESGLSLVIDPEVRKVITPDQERLTLTMKSKPLEEILHRVCEVLDIHYIVEGGVLKIVPYEEKILSLGFLPVVKEGKSSMGGDVLGNIEMGGQGGQGGTSSAPIKGEFTINAELPMETLDIYQFLTTDIAKLISKNGQFSINRLTGILYVKERPSKVRSIEKLVQEYKAKYRKQIILDAQIIEIELNKSHTLGVDWFEITNLLLGQNRIEFNTLDMTFNPARPNQPSFALTISGQPNLGLILNILKKYGELKVISKPKLRVLHSQPALISVGTSFSYIKEFKREISSSTTGGAPVVTYTTQTSSVFDGILLGITPFISEDDEIFLHVVPIKSDLVNLRDVKFGDSYFITLPTINLREMTSIVKAKPNDLIVIGGLILDRKSGLEQKLDIPVLSELFKNTEREEKKVELVILIRLLVS